MIKKIIEVQITVQYFKVKKYKLVYFSLLISFS